MDVLGVRVCGALCWIGLQGVPSRASPGALWPWLFSSVHSHSVWALLVLRRGLWPGTRQGGQGAPRLLSVSMAIAGRSQETLAQEGRHSCREGRASLAEQAPDLSVCPVNQHLQPARSMPARQLHPHASQSWAERASPQESLCSDLGPQAWVLQGSGALVPWRLLVGQRWALLCYCWELCVTPLYLLTPPYGPLLWAGPKPLFSPPRLC